MAVIVSTFEAIILGIIQGLTEFLPVSSSGHLALCQYFLGFQNLNEYILFDIICHLGTLLAIFFIFRKQIIDMFLENKTTFIQVILATLPLVPLVLIVKEIKSLFDQLQYLGFFFLITSALLYLGIRFGYDKNTDDMQKSRWRDALGIGMFQALALLPGVSRSGSTISGARLMGWNIDKAITFSFLMAIPAILGATAIEMIQVVRLNSPLPAIGLTRYAAGFITSFGIGIIALLLLIRLADKGKFHYFMWYCLVLGLLTLFTFGNG